MPTLKCKTKTVIEVDYNDLDEFISEIYGVDYEIVSDEELNNYSMKSFDIKKESLGAYDQRCFNNWKVDSNNEQFMARTILTDLCNRELIPEGEYLIDVSW